MPVKTLLSVLIFAASCVYIMYSVCVHAHTCAHLGICVLTGLEDREPQWSHSYWAGKGGMLMGPKANHLLTLY